MKTLKECLQASMGGSATPANTIGMGNPSDSSGDALAIAQNSLKKKKKKKKAKPIKEEVKEEE